MEVPQLQYFDMVVDVPVVQVIDKPVSRNGVDAAVNMQRQVPAVAGRPQIRSSTCSLSVSEVGFFVRFMTGIFRTPSSWTSSPGVAGTPGV